YESVASGTDDRARAARTCRDRCRDEATADAVCGGEDPAPGVARGGEHVERDWRCVRTRGAVVRRGVFGGGAFGVCGRGHFDISRRSFGATTERITRG